MSYKTPHHAHEFIKAAALALIHEYVLACQGKQKTRVTELLIAKREIDFHARLSQFFGPEASLGAQGVSAIDLRIASPVLEVEIKYLRKKAAQNQPVNTWKDVMKDWNWLLKLANAGDVFKKSAWVVFLPSVDHFQFHSNFQVPKEQCPNQLAVAAYAPFVGIVSPDSTAPRELEYVAGPWARDVLLHKNGTKVRVRRQIVGSPEHPVWCLVYSRVGTNARKTLNHLPEYAF